MLQYAIGKKEESFSIPVGVKYIEYGAFAGCCNLSNIEISDSVTTIMGSAFSKCDNLITIEIPNSVTVIDHHAFNKCSKLTSITLGNKVILVSGYAFSNCTNLSEVNYKGTEEQWNKISIEVGNDYLLKAKRNYI